MTEVKLYFNRKCFVVPEEKSGAGFIEKLCAFIVDKRNLFFLIFILLAVFSAFSRNWVGVENDMSYYLADTTETK